MTRQKRTNKKSILSQDNFSNKPMATSSNSYSPSSSSTIIDSLKQGFGFGMGSEIGRKGINTIINNVTEPSTPIPSACEHFIDKYTECMKHNKYDTYCQNESDLLNECKKINTK